jgi:hypothetical protein
MEHDTVPFWTHTPHLPPDEKAEGTSPTGGYPVAAQPPHYPCAMTGQG